MNAPSKDGIPSGAFIQGCIFFLTVLPAFAFNLIILFLSIIARCVIKKGKETYRVLMSIIYFLIPFELFFIYLSACTNKFYAKNPLFPMYVLAGILPIFLIIVVVSMCNTYSNKMFETTQQKE